MNKLLYSLFESSNSYLGEFDRIFRGFGAIDFNPSMLYRDDDGWYHGIDNFPSFNPEIAVKELLWKIKGKGDLRSLLEEKVYIWTPFAWGLYNYFTSSHPITKFYGSHSNMEFSQIHKARLTAFEDRILSEDDFSKEWGYIGTTTEEVLKNIYEKAKKYGKSKEIGIGVIKKNNLVDNQLSKILNIIIESFQKEYYYRDDHAKNGFHVQLVFPTRFPDKLKSFRTLKASYEMKESLDDVDEKLCSGFGLSECDSFWELPYALFQGVLLQCIIAHFTLKQVGGTELHLWCPYVLEEDLKKSKSFLSRNAKKELAVWINPKVENLESLTSEDIRFKVSDRE